MSFTIGERDKGRWVGNIILWAVSCTNHRKKNNVRNFFSKILPGLWLLCPPQRNTLTVNIFVSFFIQKQLDKFNNPLPPATSHLLQQYFPQSYKTVWGQQEKRILSLQLLTGSLTHTKPAKHKLKYKAGTLTTSSFHSGFHMSLTLLGRCAKRTVHYFCTLMQA